MSTGRTRGFALWLSALAISTVAAAADLGPIQKSGVLRVLAVASDAPDEFITTGDVERRGFDRELLEGFAALHRLKLQIVPETTWDELIPALLAGRGDLIAGRFTVTEKRRSQVDFCVEVFPTRAVVVTRRPHRAVHTLEQLRAERVGTVKGTSLAEAVAAAHVPSANVVDSISSGGLAQALRDGQVSAVILGSENAVTAQRDDAELELGLFLGAPGSLAYGVRKGDTGLRRALDEYVENLRRTPTWSRLVVKYFGEAALAVLHQARTE
jgi:polar amino acid transport system substrate-binding protein